MSFHCVQLQMFTAAMFVTFAHADSEVTRRGEFAVVFTERSPLSAVDRQLDRFLWKGERPQPEYELGEASFRVYVPEKYSPHEAYGLFVWLSAGNKGRIWHRQVYDEHRLICIAPNRVGNPREIWHRSGLALDAVHNIEKQYNIDSKRVYVAGFSKGGRMASRLGIVYADVFKGAMPIDGTDWWQHVRVEGEKSLYYRGRFRRPAGRLVAMARRENRYVLVTGEHDPNRDETWAFYERGYKRAGFRYVTYMEVPGKGHAVPDKQRFEKGIALLDRTVEADDKQ